MNIQTYLYRQSNILLMNYHLLTQASFSFIKITKDNLIKIKNKK